MNAKDRQVRAGRADERSPSGRTMRASTNRPIRLVEARTTAPRAGARGSTAYASRGGAASGAGVMWGSSLPARRRRGWGRSSQSFRGGVCGCRGMTGNRVHRWMPWARMRALTWWVTRGVRGPPRSRPARVSGSGRPVKLASRMRMPFCRSEIDTRRGRLEGGRPRHTPRRPSGRGRRGIPWRPWARPRSSTWTRWAWRSP